MTLSQLDARRIIEVLGSSGTPPERGVRHFNVGNQSLLDALDDYYLSSYLQSGGAAYKMVVGDYGSGKSHFLYCVRDIAWERGFAVAKVDLSPVETPYNDQRLVYAAVARNLIWHDEAAEASDEQGLTRFLTGTLQKMVGGSAGTNLGIESLNHPNYRGLVDTVEAAFIDSLSYKNAVLAYFDARIRDQDDLLESLERWLLGAATTPDDTKLLRDERGLGPLLETAVNRPRVREQLAELTDVENDPLSVGLYAYGNTASTRARQAWADWLMGGRRVKRMNRGAPPKTKFPSIYRVGHNARQIAYMLSGMSVPARLVGYSGLCVLIDEAESYSLLYPYQRPKAGLFFAAVTYAALQERQHHLTADQFPQHRFRDYPITYNDRQSLFFLFTVTRSDTRIPLNEWLTDEQVLDLMPDQTPQEIGQYLEKVMVYHALAYGYEVDERRRQIRRGAAEHLALGMRSRQMSIRSIVRLGVELFDLLYLYPGYDPADLMDELRHTVRS